MAIPLLLAIEAILFLAERYRFWLGRWKGCSVLLGCAAVPALLLLLLLWFAVNRVLRRRFQFALGSLLLFVTCSSLPLSWLAWDVRLASRQREAVARLKRVNADGTRSAIAVAEYDFELSARADAVTPHVPGPAVLRRLFGNDFFANVVSVKCFGKCNNGDVACVKDLARLQTFECCGTDITDEGLEPFESLAEVEEVELYNTQSVTCAGLRHLEGLRKLRRLGLGATQVGDAGTESIRASRTFNRWSSVLPR